MQLRSRIGGRVRSGSTLLVLALAALSLSTSAVAQRERRAGPSHGRGDVSRPHQQDRNAWRGGGHWAHDRHGGNLGWWWGVSGLWYPYAYPYPYPTPVYPYAYPWGPPLTLASPPEAVTPAAPPPAPYWYYCEASRAYYPYVTACPGGWLSVPATPSDASPVPQQ